MAYDMLEILKQFPQQIEESLVLKPSKTLKGKFNKIFVVGMGSSGLVGDLLSTYLEHQSNVPIFSIKTDNVPVYLDKDSLAIVISHTGDTKETFENLKKIEKSKAKMLILSSGGKILEYAKSSKTSYIELPKKLESRNSVAYTFFPVLKILSDLKVISDPKKDISETIDVLKDLDFYDKKGFFLSKKLNKKIVLIYCDHSYRGVAHRWKLMMNENSKASVYHNTYVEMIHNELMSFKKISKKFEVILFRDQNEDSVSKKKIDSLKKIMDKKIYTNEIESKGKSQLAKMFSLMYVGDFASYHLAKGFGTDPVNTDLKDRMKFKFR